MFRHPAKSGGARTWFMLDLSGPKQKTPHLSSFVQGAGRGRYSRHRVQGKAKPALLCKNRKVPLLCHPEPPGEESFQATIRTKDPSARPRDDRCRVPGEGDTPGIREGQGKAKPVRCKNSKAPWEDEWMNCRLKALVGLEKIALVGEGGLLRAEIVRTA